MGKITKDQLKSKIKKTIATCVKSKEYKSLMNKVYKISKVKEEFWKNLITSKLSGFLNGIIKILVSNDKLVQSFSAIYEKNKKNKETYIMPVIAKGVGDILKEIKKNHNK